MKLTLIIFGIIAIVCVALQIVCRISAKREKERWDKMTPEEQRKYQDEMYKRHQMG